MQRKIYSAAIYLNICRVMLGQSQAWSRVRYLYVTLWSKATLYYRARGAFAREVKMARWYTTLKRGLAYTLFPGVRVNRRVANERRQATEEGTRGNWHGVVGNHKQTAANGILFFSSLILVKRIRSGAADWQLGAESAREAQITS